MWAIVEKIIVAVVLLAAVVGVGMNIHRQRKSKCDSSCPDCPLKDQCNKKEKTI